METLVRRDTHEKAIAEENPLILGEQTTKCKRCGSELLDDSVYCMDCGSRIADDAKLGASYADLPFGTIVSCPKCGGSNFRTDQLCKQCDTDLTDVKRRLALQTSGGINCPECGMGNPSGSRYCRKCGAEMTTAETRRPVIVRCKYCGTVNGPTAPKCSSCGATL